MTREFTKSVDTVVKGDDERVAVGCVLIPDRVDHQGDFERADVIADAFNEAADEGVLHAAFPDGHAETEHRLLDEPETIAGEEYPAGTWIAERYYRDDRLWRFVKSGVLGGFSIGGRIHDATDHAGDDLPPGVEYDDGAGPFDEVTELLELTVDEVSDVDLPAVPSAEFATVKSLTGAGETEKNLLEMADTPAEFAALLQQRNGDVPEEMARELYRYLETVKTAKQCADEPAESGVGTMTTDEMSTNTETNDEPTDKSLDEMDDATLGQRIKAALGWGGGDADDGNSPEDAVDTDTTAAKAGRTLSDRNVALAKEMHDDAEYLLRDAGVECHSSRSRTYHEDKHDDYERGSHDAYGEYEDKTRDVKAEKEDEDPCWEGYEMVGLDDDGNPRCVPVEDIDLDRAVSYTGQDEPPAKAVDSESDGDTDEEPSEETTAAEPATDDLFDDVDPDRVADVTDKVNEITN